jgi:hypothetical protein
MFIKKISLTHCPNDSRLWTYLAILEYKNGHSSIAKADIERAYFLDHSSRVSPVYNAIMNNAPVNIETMKK